MGHKESLEFKRWATRKPFEFHCNYTDKTLNKVKRIYNATKKNLLKFCIKWSGFSFKKTCQFFPCLIYILVYTCLDKIRCRILGA